MISTLLTTPGLSKALIPVFSEWFEWFDQYRKKREAWKKRQLELGFSEEEIEFHIKQACELNDRRQSDWAKEYEAYVTARGAFCNEPFTLKEPKYIDYTASDMEKIA